MSASGFVGAWPAIISIILTIIGSAGVGGLLKTWLDYKRGSRKQTDDVALSLVHQQNARILILEEQQVRERDKCDRELRVLRHQMANVDSAFDGFLMMVEAMPEKAGEIAASIRKQRGEQRQAEAVEKAAAMTGGQG